MKLKRPRKITTLILLPLLLFITWLYWPAPTPQSPQQLLNITLPTHITDPKLQQKLDANFQNASPDQVIHWLKLQTNAKITFHPSTNIYSTYFIQPIINLNLKSVTAQQILNYTLRLAVGVDDLTTTYNNKTTLIHLQYQNPHTITLIYDMRRICDDLSELAQVGNLGIWTAIKDYLGFGYTLFEPSTSLWDILTGNYETTRSATSDFLRLSVINFVNSYNPTTYSDTPNQIEQNNNAWLVTASPETHHQISSLLYGLWSTIHPTSATPTPLLGAPSLNPTEITLTQPPPKNVPTNPHTTLQDTLQATNLNFIYDRARLPPDAKPQLQPLANSSPNEPLITHIDNTLQKQIPDAFPYDINTDDNRILFISDHHTGGTPFTTTRLYELTRLIDYAKNMNYPEHFDFANELFNNQGILFNIDTSIPFDHVITNIITQCISPDNWRSNGGQQSSLTFIGPCLIAHATPPQHRAIEYLLNKILQTAKIENPTNLTLTPQPDPSLTMKTFENQSQKTNAPPLILNIKSLIDPRPHPKTLNTTITTPDAKKLVILNRDELDDWRVDRSDQIDSLVSTLTQYIDPDSWKNSGSSFNSFTNISNLLIVNQTPAKQQQALNLIKSIQSTLPNQSSQSEPIPGLLKQSPSSILIAYNIQKIADTLIIQAKNKKTNKDDNFDTPLNQATQTLANRITTQITPNQWNTNGGTTATLSPFRHLLIINAPQQTHKAIKQLLQTYR